MNRSKGLGLTLVLPLAALIMVGCGDDDDNNNNNQSQQPYTCVGDVCTLANEITEDLTLTADKKWLLSGGVFIGDDVNETVLTIEPGTSVYGDTATKSMLVIRRGSKLNANGTAAAPIVFTSSKDPGTRAPGDWGGVILNGRAITNSCGGTPGSCEPTGEGDTGQYGGNDNAGSCGTLRYVRIEFAGKLISPENELNGLALQACGSGTVLEYIQVHMGADDGIEFFGGTASFKYVLVTGASDDNLDWTDGWQGKGQFLVAQQYGGIGDNGIEADNNGESNDAAPRSGPVLSNITLIGSPGSEKSDLGILLREGTGAQIHNAVVVGWGDACLDIDNDATFANAVTGSGTALSGELTLSNTIMDCGTLYGDDAADLFTVETFYTAMNQGNLTVDPGLVDPFNETAPDFRPAGGSPAASGAVVPSDSFFTQVSFKGGVDPSNDWTAGWTTSTPN